jgi:hypothetical protein
MARVKFLLFSLVSIVFLALGPGAVAAPGTPAAPGLPAKPAFHPRIGPALGIMPPLTIQHGQLQPAVSMPAQPLTPVTYHGGQTMTGGITVHTIFWSGGTSPFQGRPAGAPHNYIGMVQQYLTDVAKASTGTSGQACTTAHCNVFTVESQFGWGTTPGNITHGAYTVHYGSSDTVIDNQPYPSKSVQCASPQNTATCITDHQVQVEINRVINATHGPRGLHDIWYVFTPPNVDECISPGVCESNAFGGYHGVGNLGHGTTIYAYTGDPIVETKAVNNPGSDPEGYPDAEVTIDIVAHETNEAMTDPEGVGYMDPNGFEVGDKCEFGPQLGTPLGFAPDGSPFNQVINGHKYLTQEMWANRDNSNVPDCVQATTTTSNPLPLPHVHLTQFSPIVTGNIEHHIAGVSVSVTLLRLNDSGTPVPVASGSGTTAASGSWSVSLGGHAVGDDRDAIEIAYSGAGAPAPEQILTGNGGNPFTESGWTGWTALDNGSLVTNTQGLQGFAPPTITIEPCFQTGVEAYSVSGVAGAESPTDFCNTTSDAATAPLAAPVTAGQAVTVSTTDDRAFTSLSDPNPNLTGALVTLTVAAGEPDSASSFGNPFLAIPQGGFPSCTGDLEAQAVTCTGLVPGEAYTLTDGATSVSGAADATGTVTAGLAIKGGDAVALSNGSRTLTTLHVAHLRADIQGNGTVLSGGQCTPDEYYGPPVTTPPFNGSAGSIAGGIALTGEICPANGDATGLPASTIAQTDELSGGQTTTEVPSIVATAPLDGENVTGAFTARASAGSPGPNTTIALQISDSGGTTVFSAANVNTAGGVAVSGLQAGTYTATWVLTDANGDTRTTVTQFFEN